MYIFYFLFYIIAQFFDCRFILKSYVNFSFIEFIFVMVKDTYLHFLIETLTGIRGNLTFLLIFSANCNMTRFFKKGVKQASCFYNGDT